MRKYVTSYLREEQRNKFPVVREMEESGEYSPEVCEAVYLALEDYYTAEANEGKPLNINDRLSVLRDSADSYVSNINAEDIYEHAREADLVGTFALANIINDLGQITQISDIIYNALSLLIVNKAESHLTAVQEDKTE